MSDAALREQIDSDKAKKEKYQFHIIYDDVTSLFSDFTSSVPNLTTAQIQMQILVVSNTMLSFATMRLVKQTGMKDITIYPL